MKKIICILILTICVSCRKDPEVFDPPTKIEGLELTFINTGLNVARPVLYFVDEHTGYMADILGQIFKTTDAALTWHQQNSPTSLPLNDIWFLNSEEGFAVGGMSGCGGSGCTPPGAIMLHTTNGGETWQQVPLISKNKTELTSLYFINSTTGYAVGYGTIYFTENRGNTWKDTVLSNLGSIMLDVEFLNPAKGLITCSGGKVLRTLDGGKTWELSKPFEPGGFPVIEIVTENLIFCNGPGLMKTTDFGTTWTPVSNFPRYVSKILFTTEDIGFTFGSGKYSGGEFGSTSGSINYTTDGGITWKGDNDVPEIGAIQSASFPNPNLGYAISNRTIVKIKRQ